MGTLSESRIPHSALLQELLLALLGHTGDVFIETLPVEIAKPSTGSVDCSISLSPGLDWVSSSDRAVLQQLLKLGSYFRVLDAFVAKETNPAPQNGASSYRRALATGISEALAVYRAAVLQAQGALLGHPAPPLAALHHLLADFSALLPPLHRLVRDVQARRLRGMALLQVLCEAVACCGAPQLHSCLQRLQWHCHQVLLKQLSAWMVHGLLQDEHREFFIQPVPLPGATASASVALNVTSAMQTSSRTDVSASSPAHVAEADSAQAGEWRHGFQVTAGNLPTGVSQSMAEGILFVGRATRALQRGTMNAQQQRGGPLEEVGSSGAVAIETALRRLQQQQRLNQSDFERTIEASRAEVAGRVWRVVGVGAQLPAHLAALKATFLMADGHCFHTFLQQAERLLQAAPSAPRAAAQVAAAFQDALPSCNADALLPRLRLTFQPTPASGTEGLLTFAGDGAAGVMQLSRVEVGLGREGRGVPLFVPGLDAWDGLGLHYDLAWPLHMLITPEVLVKYGVLFKHLLRLRRVAGLLDGSWACARRRAARPATAAALRAWHLRAQMAHFIGNLQIYLQVDVVETGYSQLQAAIAGATEFAEAAAAHERFLDSLLAQAFLDMRHFNHTLMLIFGLCRRLCALLQAEDERPGAAAVMQERVSELEGDFRRRQNMVYTALRTDAAQVSQRAPYLQQLLLRLNFNGFIAAEALREALCNSAAA